MNSAPSRINDIVSRVSQARSAVLIAAVIAGIGCSSSTDPGHHLPPPQTGHPTGNVATALPVGGYVHGVAIAHNGTLLITRTVGLDVVPGTVTPFTLGAPIRVAGVPVDVAFTTDSRTAFIASVNSPAVAIFDVASSSVTGLLALGSAALRVLTTPDGNSLYVTTQGDPGTGHSSVYHFDAHTHALLDTIIVATFINGIAYDSARARLFLASTDKDSVYVIDAVHDAVTRSFTVASQPQDLAVSLDGTQLWIATESIDGVRVFDVATNQKLFEVPTTEYSYGLARSPDGAQFFVTQTGESRCAIIDAASHAVIKAFHTGAYPRRVAFDSSGSSAVIADEEAGLVLIQ